MFINSRMATIGKYCDVPVYSGKMPWYSVLFRDITPYSVIFRHIPWYSGIPGFHNAHIFLAMLDFNVVATLNVYRLDMTSKQRRKQRRPDVKIWYFPNVLKN
jgi:hypothetical protein